MLSIIENIPNVETYPLKYVFEKLKLQHKPNTLWLEFGVALGNTIFHQGILLNWHQYLTQHRTWQKHPC
jgi:hypothetical protein